MADERIKRFITDKISSLSEKYDKKGTQLAYEQGILIGLLCSLAEEDSKNLDLIVKRLKELNL